MFLECDSHFPFASAARHIVTMTCHSAHQVIHLSLLFHRHLSCLSLLATLFMFVSVYNSLQNFVDLEHVTEKTEALGEVLNGDRLVDAPYELNFLEEQRSKSLCKKNLSKEDVAKFRHAVSRDYYFEMYYDDMPPW